MDQAPRAGCDGRSCQPAGTYVSVVALGGSILWLPKARKIMVLYICSPLTS